VRKLDAYLKKQFGNARIRVVPKTGKANLADVNVGEEQIGTLTVDDEDGERSYNVQIKVTLGEAAGINNLQAIEAFLRRKFDNERIRVIARQRKTDSAEVFMGQDNIGVLFFEDKESRSCYLEMPIIDLDLEEMRLG
jgi:hypothetical protein